MSNDTDRLLKITFTELFRLLKHSKSRFLTIVCLLTLLLLAAYVLYYNSHMSQITQISPSSTAAVLGSQTKLTGCQAQGSLPDHACTPGAVMAGVTAEDICSSGYASRVRDVSSKTKRDVYDAYGITEHPTGAYEVDHLISLELGGSNDVANLWPEAAQPTPGYHEKDKVEDYLHQEICQGRMSLAQAQQAVANDWVAIYQTVK